MTATAADLGESLAPLGLCHDGEAGERVIELGLCAALVRIRRPHDLRQPHQLP